MCRCQPKPAIPVVRYDTVLKTGTCGCLTGLVDLHLGVTLKRAVCLLAFG